MIRELKIFLILFIVLSFTMHYKEFLTNPLQHILNLSKSGAFGFGALHPLIFTAILYIIVLIFRLIIKLIRRTK